MLTAGDADFGYASSTRWDWGSTRDRHSMADRAIIRDREDLMPTFRIFKYAVYILLVGNAGLFLIEDLAASQIVFNEGVSGPRFIEAYAQTMDTAAWVVLLLMFELETAVLSDDTLRAGWAAVMSAARFVCYAVIFYSAYGYLESLDFITQTVPLEVADVCSLVDAGYAYVASLNEYPALSAESCRALIGQELLQIAETTIVGSYDQLERARLLAIADIINSIDWICVVIILEVEVFLQLRGLMSAFRTRASLVIKIALYAVLFAVAAYWGIDGSLLDFWDAALWLVAFIFIEMNFFGWQSETGDAQLEFPPGGVK